MPDNREISTGKTREVTGRDGKKTMRNETDNTQTTGAAQQFLAGLAVWVLFMAAYAIA